MYWSKNVVLQNSFLLVPNKFLVTTKIRSQTNVVYFGLKTIMGPTKCWVKQNIMSNIFLDFKKCGSINCIKKTWIQICRSEKWSLCILSLWIWLRFTLYPVRCKNGSHCILWLWFTLYPVAMDHPVFIHYGSPCILVYGRGGDKREVGGKLRLAKFSGWAGNLPDVAECGNKVVGLWDYGVIRLENI